MDIDKLIELSRSIDADHTPFLDIIDQTIAKMKKIAGYVADSNHAKMLRDSLADIDGYRENFAQAFPSEMDRMKASIRQSVDEIVVEVAKFNQVHASSVQQLADLESSVPAMLAAAAEAAKAAVPVVVAPAIPALHPGEDLIAQLMSMRMPGQKAPSGVRSAGNIWENWKPGAGGT